MTKKQKELAEKYGTLEQFTRAIWRTYDDLIIKRIEAQLAIRKYRLEWEAAGKRALLLIWDNASWHISAAVKDWLRQYLIELMLFGESACR